MEANEKLERLITTWNIYILNPNKNFDIFTAKLSQFIREGADINKMYHGDTFLQLAIEKGDIKLVEFLVKNGAEFTNTEITMCQSRIEEYVSIMEYLVKKLV
jgi:ankyrin repeat protein